MSAATAGRLDGKAAIVTGAGNGIGRAIALGFGRAGAAVLCVDVEDAAAAETARLVEEAGGRALGESCDVTQEAETRRAAERAASAFGGIQVLVNGAAADDPTGSILDLAPADWTRTLAVNVTGAFLMSRAVLPAMIAGGGGSIIHIASQLGRVGAPGRPAYCASKGALIQLAKVMAADHAAQGVRVNTLSPGAVETRRLVRRFGDMDTARREAGPKHLLGRLGQPEEIAAAALFLAGDESSFMTGADLLVDGGYTAV
jgi:NAD(P)-dependent dehydrogenase (short-subunit alcohol dehydrogenase family)